MVCHQCGKSVDPGQHFCSNCGASLRGVTDPTVRVPTAQPASPPATEPTEEWAAEPLGPVYRAERDYTAVTKT